MQYFTSSIKVSKQQGTNTNKCAALSILIASPGPESFFNCNASLPRSRREEKKLLLQPHYYIGGKRCHSLNTVCLKRCNDLWCSWWWFNSSYAATVVAVFVVSLSIFLVLYSCWEKLTLLLWIRELSHVCHLKWHRAL